MKFELIDEEINSINNNKEKFNVYTSLELAYEEQFKNNMEAVENLYPKNWYSITNYDIKIDIIVEALKSNCLITNTDGYNKYIGKN